MPLKLIKPLLATPDRSVARVPFAPQKPKNTDDFYGSAAWKELRSRVVRERGRVCESCGRTGMRPFVDHVVERRDGGAPLDPRNLKVLCGSCHGSKTLAEKARRRSG